jgi:hypothetical protein
MTLPKPMPLDSIRATREVFDEHLAFADRARSRKTWHTTTTRTALS